MVFDAEPFIKKMMRTLNETGYTILTVEYDRNHKMTTRTFPVDEIEYLRGSAWFYYQGEEMFHWYNQKYTRIYEGETLDCNFTIKELPNEYTEEQLTSVVDACYELYGWSYNHFGTSSDIDRFADEYYMSDKSRQLLHYVVLKRKQENYVKEHGVENDWLNELMREYER